MFVLAEGAAPVVHPGSADGVFSLLWLVIALPLLGAVILLVVGPLAKGRLDKNGHLIGVALPVISFVISLVMFIAMLGRSGDDRQVGQHLYTWFEAGGLKVGADLLYDPLSALFLLLITGVGSLIHIYSIGYMEHDVRRRRFFGYLNLFIAAMLTLVLAANYLVLFLGWEGVGLASYLLIGFWQYKHSAAAAAKKAFILNRVGDIGLSLGVGLFFVTFGTTDFTTISENAGQVSEGTMTALGLLLLLAACGKSAQVPLQSWLLDAMEGPTPVSALIHAATMVTAGVYLIVRSNFVFDYAPDARTVVMVVAVVTLLWGAFIGCAKDDIKKVLAGSTMSQIGYMMLAAGIGPAGYPFAIFHLLNHGFFKADMFLGAGSVMHGMDDDVDMRHYGALRKLMPVTFLTFSMGYLAIIGFPGFSGFWSKDKIIEAALTQNWLAGVLAMIGAGVTGFYMTRLMFMTFFTDKRWEEGVHPHESPAVMTVPLIVLAALSVFGGAMLIGDWIVDFLEPVTGTVPAESPPIPALAISAIVVVIVAVGVGVAWYFVGRRDVPREAPQEVSWPVRAARAELYGNEINDELAVKPGGALVTGLTFFDEAAVDGFVEGTAAAVGTS
jgi:NADH-quinone oxidoreductase subunit L